MGQKRRRAAVNSCMTKCILLFRCVGGHLRRSLLKHPFLSGNAQMVWVDVGVGNECQVVGNKKLHQN